MGDSGTANMYGSRTLPGLRWAGKHERGIAVVEGGRRQYQSYGAGRRKEAAMAVPRSASISRHLHVSALAVDRRSLRRSINSSRFAASASRTVGADILVARDSPSLRKVLGRLAANRAGSTNALSSNVRGEESVKLPTCRSKIHACHAPSHSHLG